MLALGVVRASASTVGGLTDQMLPITARHFTANVGLIALLAALHRACGCLVQPYAAWKSDRHWSSAGRRRPFLLWAIPFTLAAVCALGLLPAIVPAGWRHLAAAAVVLLLVDLAMQASQAVCVGCLDPLYPDLFRDDLGRAMGVQVLVTNAAAVAMAFYLVPWADYNEFVPYGGCALLLGAAWVVMLAFNQERSGLAAPHPGRYNPLLPLAELRDPYWRRVAVVAAAVLVCQSLLSMLHSLFVTETLHLTKTDLGRSAALGISVSFVCSYGIGGLIDRLGPRLVLAASFLVTAAAAVALALFVDNAWGLYLDTIPLGLGLTGGYVASVPLIYRAAPANRRGTIFAMIQTTRGGAACLATIAVGQLAGLVHSYRACYAAAVAACLAGLVGVLRLPPDGRTAPRGSTN